MHLNHFRYTSNGLGSSDETFQSLRFAHGKRPFVNLRKQLFILFLVFLSSMNFRTRLDISVLSLIIYGQRCLETFKLIKRNLRRVTSLHANQNMFLCIRLTKILTTCIFAAWLSIIILLSGDIHENPGPDSVTSLADEESDLSSCSTESIDHLFSMMHLNIQSIVPKLDLVRTESMAYDIMAKIFNKSLQHAHFPSSWKYANVTPIHKKDDKSLPNNYRPVSLLSQIGKSMEKCVHKYMFNYLYRHQLLTPSQSGFIPKDSTTNQLIHLYHTFCEAVDDGKEVRVVFCDISKAFDRVWHRGLLHKLENIGCTGQLLEWFRNYLSDRKQRVVIRGQSSNWADVEAGVPQGSVLGPLLFLIFINDIVHSINSFIRLFADDTSLYIIVDNPNEAAITLNTDLDKIYKWAEIWLVEFNPLKTFTMTISRRLLSPPHPPLIFNNVQVQVTQSHKHLGLTFSSNCTWSEHIKLITRTAWQRLNMLRGLKFKLKRKSLEKLYIGFVRPLLEYSDTVWDNCRVDEKKST